MPNNKWETKDRSWFAYSAEQYQPAGVFVGEQPLGEWLEQQEGGDDVR